VVASSIAEVADLLDYSDEGLVTAESHKVPLSRSHIWDEARAKFGVDAVYFKGSVPVVFFKRFSAASSATLAELHRRLWNFNKAPLLIVVLPDQVQVFNCFAPPTAAPSPGPALLAAVRLVGDVLEQRRLLEPFAWSRLEQSGLGPDTANPFSRRHRVDRYLLHNLDAVRRQLTELGLTEQIANALLGRSIFVRYLEDRGVLSPQYLQRFGTRSYIELLNAPVNDVYAFFAQLADRFNGDIFPVDIAEQEIVQSQHLRALNTFLSGTDMLSGQSYFWAYDFSSIPIELISSIYEEFLRHRRRETAAYYTPPEIVSFVLDEVLPWEVASEEPRILDPACGSGAFLVEAYRRLVYRWIVSNNGARPPIDRLQHLLLHCIHGIDIEPEAVSVAAFSCYLAMLDFIEPKAIWEEVRFPKLLESNLFVQDFFDQTTSNGGRFDVIVGNPPWQSHLGGAESYVRRGQLPVGDQQIAQAFLWRSLEMLEADGRLCLLMPSKGLLFNSSGPNSKFRQALFARANVRMIVDFSAFRHQLFHNATGPMALVFCDGSLPDSERNEVLYCTPHPSPLGDSLAGIVISGDEVHRLRVSEVLAAPFVWKTTLWGTSRDYVLIRRLREYFPSLRDFASQRQWVIRQGLQLGSTRSHYSPELADLPYIPPKNLLPFRVTSPSDLRVGSDRFRRAPDPRIYQPPHLLIRRGVLNGRRLASAFLEYPAIFSHSIIGVADPKGTDSVDLKLLSAFINSSVGRYYHFLTSVSWGVERDEVELQDFATFPIPLPARGNDSTDGLLQTIDLASSDNLRVDALPAELDAFVFDMYELSATDRRLVRDVIDFGLERYASQRYGTAFSLPSLEDLVTYARAAATVLNSAGGLNSQFSPIVYEGTASYRAVTFALTGHPSEGSTRQAVQVLPGLQEALSRLGDQMTTQIAGNSFYLRPNLKVFESDAIHVVKPAERRYWTESAAYSDADEILAQTLHAFWVASTA